MQVGRIVAGSAFADIAMVSGKRLKLTEANAVATASGKRPKMMEADSVAKQTPDDVQAAAALHKGPYEIHRIATEPMARPNTKHSST